LLWKTDALQKASGIEREQDEKFKIPSLCLRGIHKLASQIGFAQEDAQK
jgi:hypothetical protein